MNTISDAEVDTIILEKISVENIRSIKENISEHLEYWWRHYSELARQRNEIQDDIKKTLIQSSKRNFTFQNMKRVVKYKYSLHPLSTLGSLTYIGGRFNTGRNVNSEIPFFPGLYLAKDKNTALQEHLGQVFKNQKARLSPREIALTNPCSETIVSISGQIDMVFDLTKVQNLTDFVNLTKDFSLSPELILLGEKLNIKESKIIKTAPSLLSSLLNPHWRILPNNFDVPSSSQIFGHLVYSAGIEGILYPSKFTNGLCLVIFPHNFSNSDSCLIMDDETPHKKVPKKIDKNNWRICDLTFDEIEQTIIH